MLLLALPFLGRAHSNAPWATSFRKWIAVFRWSVNRDELIKKHYPTVSQ